MKIWIPSALYHAIPLLCVIIGFLIVMFIHKPAGIVVAAIMYIYSFSILWMRDANVKDEQV